MLGREGEQMLLFGIGRKKITVERQGGINTLRSEQQRLLSKTQNLQARSRNLREQVTSAG
jgi:hypothetical protein